ncbi:periodic tryptophan protein 1 homolog [Neodiprion fabricii]|uniref:periodic tryptophan protein 1 homolog n=1 Tax=Neodiprion fabricii TaxID=2872261 RepID=UPI001ED91693|nr:periodic tryptophan protein 1 homolog [Neodiprion fabricii]
MNFIPCVTWVKRGVAAANPDKVQLTPQELEQIINQTQSDLRDVENGTDDSDEESTNSKKNGTKNEKITGDGEAMEDDEYHFDKYDEEGGNIHCNIGGLAVINEDGTDPYITIPDSGDEDSEKEDDIIKPDDNLVVMGHVEGDASILEVFVYNEAEGSFYCHHDILLPSFPLCLEWLNFDPSDAKPGNFCAIGNMTPIIEVWDLDLVDCLEPVFKLGSKPSKKRKQKRVGHRDAVLDVAWNCNYTHVLASGSVDQTVLLWDLDNGTPVTKLNTFNEKVQAIKWHPSEAQHLLTGCGDKNARLFDCRTENNFKLWECAGEVERVLWNHFDPNYCFISTDNGNIHYIDIRNEKPLWLLSAHEKEVTGLSLSTSCPGLLVSCSTDSYVKVWDAVDNKTPELVWETKTNLGALQCLETSPNSPFMFAAGGDNKSHNFKLFDLLESTSVSERFSNRPMKKIVCEENPPEVDVKLKSNTAEVMDVTDEMNSMALGSVSTNSLSKKKKRNKK